MPTFLKAMADSASKGCLVKPLIAGFMGADEALGVTVRVSRPLERAPDGWFHASTHPSLPVTELVAYLRAPQVKGESRDYISGMSTMVGTVMGDLARQILEKKQVAIPPRSDSCLVCGLPQPRRCREHGGVDALLRSRGHLDGVLNFTPQPTSAFARDLSALGASALGSLHGYDHKTAKTMTLKDVPEMDEAAFRQKWPKYWWQAQEYMRLTGLRNYIVLVQGLGNPWTMLEFHVPYDEAAAASIEARYAEAIRLAAA